MVNSSGYSDDCIVVCCSATFIFDLCHYLRESCIFKKKMQISAARWFHGHKRLRCFGTLGNRWETNCWICLSSFPLFLSSKLPLICSLAWFPHVEVGLKGNSNKQVTFLKSHLKLNINTASTCITWCTCSIRRCFFKCRGCVAPLEIVNLTLNPQHWKVSSHWLLCFSSQYCIMVRNNCFIIMMWWQQFPCNSTCLHMAAWQPNSGGNIHPTTWITADNERPTQKQVPNNM